MNRSTGDITLGILYATAAFFFVVVVVVAYTRYFRKRKLQAVNSVEFITSLDNIFSHATQFLIVTNVITKVRLSIKNLQEEELNVLIDTELDPGEHPVDFDPASFEEGKYYLYLDSDDAKILRRIEIRKTSE